MKLAEVVRAVPGKRRGDGPVILWRDRQQPNYVCSRPFLGDGRQAMARAQSQAYKFGRMETGLMD